MAKTANQEYWKQIIVDQMNSGLTQIKWCALRFTLTPLSIEHTSMVK